MAITPALDRDEGGAPDQLEPGTEFVANSRAQLAVFRSNAPVVAYSGRLGSAKSRTILEAADFDCWNWPDNRVAMTRKVAAHLFGSTLDIYLSEVIHPKMKQCWKPHAVGGAAMEYPNGSRMIWFGLDDPGKALSAQYGSAYVDQAEELDEHEANAIEGRLRLRRPPTPREDGTSDKLRRRMVYAFNPDADTHWANRRFGFKDMQEKGEWHRSIYTQEPRQLLNKLWVPAGQLLAEVVIAGPQDNVGNLTTDYQLRLSEYKGRWYDRYVLGKWGSFEGQVYDCFDAARHVIDTPPEWEQWGGYPPPTWRRYRAVDFGYENPFVMQWLTLSPAGAWFLYREIYHSRRLVSDHAAQARQLEADELATVNACVERWNLTHPSDRMEPLKRLPFTMSVSDHDAEDRATLEREGFVTDPAVKDVTSGIQTVYQAVSSDKLFLLRHARVEMDQRLKDEGNPTCTAEEFSGYHYPRTPGSSEKTIKEAPVKVRDHGVDATRYCLQTARVRGDLRVIRISTSPRAEED